MMATAQTPGKVTGDRDGVDWAGDDALSAALRTMSLALLLVFIITVPWEGSSKIDGFGNLSKLAGIAAGFVWLLSIVSTQRIRKPDVFHVVLGLYVIWNAVTVFWTLDVNRTLSQAMTLGQSFALAYLVWDLCRSRGAWLAMLQAYVVGVYVAIGLAWMNYRAGAAYYSNFERFSAGEDSNPDGFGFLVVLAIPVACYLAVSHGSGGGQRVWRWVNMAFIPIALLGISLSGTRTSFISCLPAIAFGFVALRQLRPQTRWTAVLFLCGSMLCLMPFLLSLKSLQRLGTIQSELTEGDLNQRTGLWQAGLQAFQERPVVGVGSNAYRSINRLEKVAHNSFVSVLTETGLVGLLLFAILLAIVWKRAWNLPAWPALFCITWLVVWTLGASTLTWEHRKTTWLLFSLIVAGGALCYRPSSVRNTTLSARGVIPR